MSSSSSHYFVVTQPSQNQWRQLLAGRAEANFLQSDTWADFEHRLGKKTFFLGLADGDSAEAPLAAGALVVKEEAKRGWYLTVAGGPLIGQVTDTLSAARQFESSPEVLSDLPLAQQQLQALSQALIDLAKQEKCSFIRVRPQLLDVPQVRDMFQQLGYQPAPMHLTADLTLQLDLTASADQLLADMRKNTRYEVRRAEKLGIVVEISEDPTQIPEFYQHQLYLAEKHGFVPFAQDFLQHQFDAFVAQGSAALLHATLDGQLLASAFLLFYNHEAVYHYGISTPANDKLPGSYACQWTAIQEAKKRGCTRYNFWGVAPKDQPSHRFAGVGLFKRGFGGVEVPYLPAHDLPVSWQYGAVNTFERFRKKLRRL